MSACYYAPSGRLPADALVLAAGFALATLAPAWLYAWLTIHSPFFPLDCLATIAFAAAMGVAAQLAARLGKARNPRWMGRLGLMIGLAGWYAQWAAWLAVAEADSFFSLIGDPFGMWRFAAFVAENDARYPAGMRVEGSALVASWLIELIVLASLPRAMARATAEAPFCEATGRWMPSCELPRKFAWIDEPEVVVHRLETASGEFLSILADCVDEHPTRYSVVTVHCGVEDRFISIHNVRIARSAHKEKRIAQPVIAYLRLDATDTSQLFADGTGFVSMTSSTQVSAWY